MFVSFKLHCFRMKSWVYLVINISEFGEHVRVQFFLFLVRFSDHLLAKGYLINGGFILRLNFKNLKKSIYFVELIVNKFKRILPY